METYVILPDGRFSFLPLHMTDSRLLLYMNQEQWVSNNILTQPIAESSLAQMTRKVGIVHHVECLCAEWCRYYLLYGAIYFGLPDQDSFNSSAVVPYCSSQSSVQ